MKRFLLFKGLHYYPDGGAEDFAGDFDSVEEAVNTLENWIATSPELSDYEREDFYQYRFANILDLQNKIIVWQNGKPVQEKPYSIIQNE